MIPTPTHEIGGRTDSRSGGRTVQSGNYYGGIIGLQPVTAIGENAASEGSGGVCNRRSIAI
jgi:hypothetical protein